MPLRRLRLKTNQTKKKRSSTDARYPKAIETREAAYGRLRLIVNVLLGTTSEYMTLNGGSLGSWIDEERSKVR